MKAGRILLVVEDDRTMRGVLREMLELEGFAVITAANGRKALEHMTCVRPDLIISDIRMPEMDGYAFFQAVRTRLKWMTIPFIFLTGLGEKENVLAGKDLGAEDYLVKPVTPDELFTAVRSRLTRARELAMAHLQQSYEASLTVLANAIEMRDQYTRSHVDRVTAYTLAIAYQMGWREERLRGLRIGGILHDIGKIEVPESILRKTEPLTEEEWAGIRRHTVTGVELIRDIPYLAAAIPVIRHHHERWDGNGYPDRLRAEAIPLEARIVAVADSFDAMTTTRVYRASRSLQQAYEEILSDAGRQYDPAVVAAFQRAWDAEQIQPISGALESFR